MLEKEHFDSAQMDVTIENVLQALEALALLYNSNKIQLELNTVPPEYLNKSDFWVVMRNKRFFYNKNKETSIKSLPWNTQKLI